MGVCERTDRRQYAADVDGRSAGAGRVFFRDERYAAAGVCARLAANELVFPLLVMIGEGGGALGAEGEMVSWLAVNGWDYRMALCAMVFCLFHWPCSTTVLTIRKETESRKWTLLAVLLPTVIGLLFCRLIAVL